MWIGIDLGGTKIEGVNLDANGIVQNRERRPTPKNDGYHGIITSIADLVFKLEQQSGETCTVGIGTPGAISARTGLMKNCNSTILNNKPLKEDIEKALAREIKIANDADCFALSEAHDGAAAGKSMVFGVIIGTGVGGGIVSHGQIHNGPNAIAGEWGHLVLDSQGPKCYCGRQGCIETYLSGPGLAQNYRNRGGDNTHDAKKIIANARDGDPLAKIVMQNYYDYFGRALAMVINILDPDIVVLGGGLSQIDELYQEGITAVAKHVFSDDLRTPIVQNLHGDASGVLGAARLWPLPC
ncbi:MAG: ROK family protein [Deltaproteobacteria bacterium]|nr:ROK family protein [Deltaproteobacteria bacterium]